MVDAVLVTGGAGYIGSHACKALSRSGYLPVTYDNLSRGHERAVRWGPLERGDIADTLLLRSVMAKYSPVAVMHFAAFCYVGESVAEPSIYYHNNVWGSLCLLEAMRLSGIDKLILSSSCATYGNPQSLPIAETHQQIPTNPYGTSKLIVEHMLRDFEAAYGLRWVSLRYFNAAGADPMGEIGEEHSPETHIIPLAIRAAETGRDPLMVFGADYPTPDGTAIRDYVHVADLADAHLAACKHLLSGGDSGAVNLGTGRGHSVLEVISAVERVCGRTVPIQYGPRRPGDPPALVADAARARAVLGWQPRFMELDMIVRTGWEWHRRQAAEKPNE
jgi:UDP-glucose-4-epimerase GalE